VVDRAINMQDRWCSTDLSSDTVSVFQIESRAQIAMLPRTASELDDLTVGPSCGRADRRRRSEPFVRRRGRWRDPNYVVEMPGACGTRWADAGRGAFRTG
jgi:DNA polymerase III alpha subunit